MPVNYMSIGIGIPNTLYYCSSQAQGNPCEVLILQPHANESTRESRSIFKTFLLSRAENPFVKGFD